MTRLCPRCGRTLRAPEDVAAALEAALDESQGEGLGDRRRLVIVRDAVRDAIRDLRCPLCPDPEVQT